MNLAQQGDEFAFTRLYESCRDKVYGQVFAAVGDPDLADDLTQDVFIKAFLGLKSLRSDASLTTWLHRIAANRIIDFGRGEAQIQKRQTSLDHVSAGAALPIRPSITLAITLREAISRLPDIYRDALVLYDIEGFTHPQIAKKLAVREGTSRARLSKPRSYVRRLLLDPPAIQAPNSAAA